MQDVKLCRTVYDWKTHGKILVKAKTALKHDFKFFEKLRNFIIFIVAQGPGIMIFIVYLLFSCNKIVFLSKFHKLQKLSFSL